MYFACI
jgi:transposase InsO family protein